MSWALVAASSAPRRAARAVAPSGAVALVALGFGLRVAIAVWNGFFGPSFGAEADAAEFHLRAVELLEHLEPVEFTIGWIYTQFLATVYGITGESLFVGSLLSCIAWLASGWMLLRTARELGLAPRETVLAAFFFALLPTSLLHTAVTLREAYQLMFVNLACWGGVRVLVRGRASGWLLLLAGCLGMGVLHGALSAFAAVLVALVVLLRRPRRTEAARRNGPLPIVATAVLLLVLFAWAFDALFPAVQTELLESLIHSQQGYIGADARAQYRTEFAIEGVAGILTFVPVALVQYLFEPFPWRGLSVVDLGLVAENALRLWLIVCIVRGIRQVPAAAKPAVLLLVLAYAALEAIWAPGTVNWGTAARHHIPSLGILLTGAMACRQARAQRRRRPARPAQRPSTVPCPES